MLRDEEVQNTLKQDLTDLRANSEKQFSEWGKFWEAERTHLKHMSETFKKVSQTQEEMQKSWNPENSSNLVSSTQLKEIMTELAKGQTQVLHLDARLQNLRLEQERKEETVGWTKQEWHAEKQAFLAEIRKEHSRTPPPPGVQDTPTTSSSGHQHE